MRSRPLVLALASLLLAGSAPALDLSFGMRAAQDRLAPLTVTFTSPFPADADVTWDFGDGTSTRGGSPAHTFWTPGAYRVTVTVNSDGRRYTGAMDVQVRDAGPEQARVVLLLGLGEGRAVFSEAGSRVYAPAQPRWTLNGRPVTGSPVTVPDGQNVVRLDLPGRTGTVSREVRFTSGKLGGNAAFEAEVLRLTNDARARGYDCAAKRFGGGPVRGPLRRNANLDVAARAQSAGMAFGGYFDHVSALDGSAPGDRARASGYAWTKVAENIAGGQKTPQEVVTGWLQSPGHCRNIMGDYEEIGLSYVTRDGTTYGTYWTQVFGNR
ncbi:CAP domain-containing protein [Deinococcus pimensis]|uniref:CAP domain-containing protein n=1 Tax=Deinococcus pimensis TaxID=309888 RepID=UPI000486BF47|nr:CAP domain-containing protein [Deinococcus pimensis]